MSPFLKRHTAHELQWNDTILIEEQWRDKGETEAGAMHDGREIPVRYERCSLACSIADSGLVTCPVDNDVVERDFGSA